MLLAGIQAIFLTETRLNIRGDSFTETNLVAEF